MCGVVLENPKNPQKYCKACSIKALKSTRYKKTEDDYMQTCQQCGHKFVYERKKKYCSIECRTVASGRCKRKPAAEPGKSLSEIARIRNEAGISYGQYVARYESR